MSYWTWCNPLFVRSVIKTDGYRNQHDAQGFLGHCMHVALLRNFGGHALAPGKSGAGTCRDAIWQQDVDMHSGSPAVLRCWRRSKQHRVIPLEVVVCHPPESERTICVMQNDVGEPASC